MEIFDSIGARLLQVREAMDKTQSDFAAIAAAAGVPGATRQSQAKYEKGLATPSAAYLSAIATAGADVLYILTGQRSQAVPQLEPSKPINDRARLASAIEAVEAGLAETKRRLPPHKKAELVLAAYDLMAQPDQSRDNVIRLVRLAA